MGLDTIFMGTPAFSVPTLRALHAAGHRIRAVYTQPPRAAGRRGLALTPSPVQVAAEGLGLDVRTPLSLKDKTEIERLEALQADVAVVVAYGLLLPQAALDAPRQGCLNGHASLLPRWRGAAPIQRAIEAGDGETGMMVMRMEAGLDTGPVAITKTMAILAEDTAADLHDRLAALSAEAMVQALKEMEDGTIYFEGQVDIAARTGRDPLYARKIDKAEAELDLSDEAGALARRINAFSPFPGAWTMVDFGAGPERVKLLRATTGGGKGTALRIACGTGTLEVLELQRAGGKAMTAADFIARTPPPHGILAGGA